MPSHWSEISNVCQKDAKAEPEYPQMMEERLKVTCASFRDLTLYLFFFQKKAVRAKSMSMKPFKDLDPDRPKKKKLFNQVVVVR